MAPATQEKVKKTKRKSQAAELDGPSGSGGDGVKVNVLDPSSSAGPAFVNFPSVRPSKATPFTIYSRDVASTSALPQQQTIIAAETEDVEYFSTNRDRREGAEGNDCQYLPAIYDPTTHTLTVHPSAPLYLLAHRVKRLRTAALPSATRTMAAAEYRAKRNTLGEAFGTKKAKSQIKAEERNRVDVGAMEGVKGHLMDSIGERSTLPAKDEVVPPNELIPAPNITTSDPSQVYSRHTIIPPQEWSAIDVTPLVKAADDKARSAALPYRRSRWLSDKMRRIAGGSMSSSEKRSSFKIIYHLSLLLQLNSISSQLGKLNPSEILAKFPAVPSPLVNALLDRFTDKSGKRHVIGEKMRVKLLAWICVCYLWVDGWRTDTGDVAKDLSMPPSKIADMYRSLGCKVEVLSPEERQKAGLTLQEASKNKRATLKAPVVFPRPKMFAAARR